MLCVCACVCVTHTHTHIHSLTCITNALTCLPVHTHCLCHHTSMHTHVYLYTQHTTHQHLHTHLPTPRPIHPPYLHLHITSLPSTHAPLHFTAIPLLTYLPPFTLLHRTHTPLHSIMHPSILAHITLSHPSTVITLLTHLHTTPLHTHTPSHTPTVLRTGHGVSRVFRFMTNTGEWVWIQMEGLVRYKEGTKEPQFAEITCKVVR